MDGHPWRCYEEAAKSEKDCAQRVHAEYSRSEPGAVYIGIVFCVKQERMVGMKFALCACVCLRALSYPQYIFAIEA